MSNSFRRGFTLIELLIVITIIGVLAGLTLASYGGAQSKARDGVRKSDLAQMKRALELAKSDCRGSAYYPYLGGATALVHYVNMGNYLSDPDLTYISSAPKDPKNGAVEGTITFGYGYQVLTPVTDSVCPDPNPAAPDSPIQGSSKYSLYAPIERTSDADATSSREKCASFPTPAGGSVLWTDAQYNGYYVICNN